LFRSISDTKQLQINFQAISARAQLSLSNAILRFYCRQACSLRWRCMESLLQETECGNQCICHQCGNQCNARFCLGDSCCHQGALGQSVLNANKNYKHEDFKSGCLRYWVTEQHQPCPGRWCDSQRMDRKTLWGGLRPGAGWLQSELYWSCRGA